MSERDVEPLEDEEREPGEIPYCGMCGYRLPDSQTDGDWCNECWKVEEEGSRKENPKEIAK